MGAKEYDTEDTYRDNRLMMNVANAANKAAYKMLSAGKDCRYMYWSGSIARCGLKKSKNKNCIGLKCKWRKSPIKIKSKTKAKKCYFIVADNKYEKTHPRYWKCGKHHIRGIVCNVFNGKTCRYYISKDEYSEQI